MSSIKYILLTGQNYRTEIDNHLAQADDIQELEIRTEWPWHYCVPYLVPLFEKLTKLSSLSITTVEVGPSGFEEELVPLIFKMPLVSLSLSGILFRDFELLAELIVKVKQFKLTNSNHQTAPANPCPIYTALLSKSHPIELDFGNMVFSDLILEDGTAVTGSEVGSYLTALAQK